MEAQYVARVGNGRTTHAIMGGEWHYDRDNATVCGRAATAVEHKQSGKPLEITCKQCATVSTPNLSRFAASLGKAVGL